ncbi:MAG: porin [Burkholderiales bacterium]|nr:porin [Burkholderiales bacterium]
MNHKKVLAVAIGALIAAPAFADNPAPTVTLYGLADVGLRIGSSGDGSRTQVESGQGFGSRIGVKGEQWFDDGSFKGLFQAEAGVNYSTGKNTQGGLPYGRQIYAGLSSSSMGTFTFGRQYTPAFIVMDSVDAFDTGFGGNLANTLGFSSFNSSRADNYAQWTSPNVSGFTFKGGYTSGFGVSGACPNGTGQECAGASTAAQTQKAGTGFLGSIEYTWDKLYIGGAYQNLKADPASSTINNNNSDKYFIGGVTYDFGVAKLFTSYASGSVTNAAGLKIADDNGWGIGATVPLAGHNTLVTQYSHYGNKLDSTHNCNLYGLGDEYQAAKALMLYAMAAYVHNSTAGACYPAGAASNDQGTVPGHNAQNLMLGMVYRF